MQGKKLITQRDIITGKTDGFRLKYYLLASAKDKENNGDGEGLRYGILIEKQQRRRTSKYGQPITRTSEQDIRQWGVTEFGSIDDLTHSRKEALSIIGSLCQGIVTPVSLQSIIEDYLAVK